MEYGFDAVIVLHAAGAIAAIGVGWRRVSGSITAYASGERGAGVGFVYIIPVPFFFTTIPESAEVCRGLGRALARFIAQ